MCESTNRKNVITKSVTKNKNECFFAQKLKFLVSVYKHLWINLWYVKKFYVGLLQSLPNIWAQ